MAVSDRAPIPTVASVVTRPWSPLSRAVRRALPAMQAGTAGRTQKTSPIEVQGNSNGNDPRANARAAREPDSPDEAMPAPAQTGSTQKNGPHMADRRNEPMTIATTAAGRHAWPARDRALMLWFPRMTLAMAERVRRSAPTFPLIPHAAANNGQAVRA